MGLGIGIGLVSGGSPRWTPLSQTGLMLWVKDTGFNPSQWTDQSSNARHLTQASGPAQPSAGTAINGRATVHVTGTQFMQSPAFNYPPPFTLIVVASGPASQNGKFMCDSVDASGVRRNAIYGSSPSAVAMHAGLDLGATWNPLAAATYICTFNGATSVFRINGANRASGTSGAREAQGLTLGGNNTGAAGWIGDYGEAALIDHTLSAGELTQWETWLRQRWATW